MAAPRFKPHDESEYIKLLSWMRGAKSILEIGSRFGYPLVDFAHCMEGLGRVVSVDLPDSEGWNDRLSSEAIAHLRDNILKLYNEGYDARLLEGDSRDPNIIESVRDLGPYDVIFIDGDHSYEGVKSDWNNYGPLGKRIIFHDIREPEPPENMSLEVWKLWDELCETEETEEFLAEGSKMGIGKIERTTVST